MYAYVIGTFHTKEKVNVFSVKVLVRYIVRSNCDINNGVESRDKQWC